MIFIFFSTSHRLLLCLCFVYEKNVQSAADKHEDESVLGSALLMRLRARGRVLNTSTSPASAAALQGLKKPSVAYTRYITNGIKSAITHLAGNKTLDVVTSIFSPPFSVFLCGFCSFFLSRILKIKAKLLAAWRSRTLPAFVCEYFAAVAHG